jgi:hypothetical protein
MPLTLTPAERAMLDALATPIDAARRPEFMGAVEKELAAASLSAIGPGTVHRIARTVLRSFWTAPPDLRQGVPATRAPQRLELLEQTHGLD